MEFSWALQHQANDQNGRNHPENHHEDVNIISQVSARRLLSVTGRGDFVGGIDNEALDFSQLEDFINSDSEQPATYFADTLAHNENGGGTVPHNGRIEAPTSQPVVAQQQPSPRLPSPQMTHPVSIACISGTTTVPNNNGGYKDPQSYVHPHALPESPPDSGSEPPYSPPGHNDTQHVHSPHQKAALQEILMHHQNSQYPSNLLPPSPRALPSATTDPLLLTPVLTSHLTSGTPSLPTQPQIGSSLVPLSHEHSPGINTLYSSLQSAPKKRKLSQDGLIHVKQEPELGTVEHSCSSSSAVVDNDDVADNSYIDASYQCIRFHPFQQTSWHVLCDHNLKELPIPHYRVDADKGFNFSNSDDAFVCQKKNHFQITCHSQLQGEAIFVRTGEGLKKISGFQLHFYGVKVESPSQTIRVEQSQSDRSKKPFHPVTIELGNQRVTKVTVGRLHFSETTSNNMRKKGKPNPDQRYFHLVVGLHAHTADQASYQVVAHASERIIVRASNPGQFESEGSGVGAEGGWQRGAAPDSVYHAGRVGINTDRPDEALVVHGNMKVTGHIVQPSDARAKQNVQEVDTREQLRNVQQLRVVRYRYAPEFAQHSGLDVKQEDTGVIAQEVQQILPEAVLPAGDIVLPNGQRIENFLVVNKERIFMENVGAVKELCKVTDSLETRIDQLERINKRLAKLKRGDSLKSSISTVSSISGNKYSSSINKSSLHGKTKRLEREEELLCSNKFIQIIIVILILIMAFCLVAMATLYFLEYQKRSSIEWPTMASNGMLAIGPAHPSTVSTISNYERRYNSLLHSTLSPLYTKHGSYTRGLDGGLSVKSNSLTTPPPHTKQQLYSQEIAWYPISHPGSQPKLEKNNEFPGNWLSKTGAGAVPSNVDENDQSSDVDSSSTNKGPIPLGRPEECPTHFTELESPCQVYCCTAGIHQLEDPQPDHPPEKKSISDHLEQPLSMSHEEKRKLAKGFQNGISPSNPSTQTLVKEINYKYLHKRARRETGGDWGEVASNAAGSLPPEPRPQLIVAARNFNTSLDQRYCSPSSSDTPNNISCIIPLSKHMPDTHLTLHFVGMPWYWQIVEQCPFSPNSNIDETMMCGWSYTVPQQAQYIENNNQPSDNQSFSLDVAHYLRKTLKFRIPTIQPQENICRNKHGVDYLEFTLHFYRDCDEQ
ncbi:myelin regulatory factor-like protein isoform X3 [Camponotus floridanus]|uniref:myelin regulatory factor-like protein isoform X3 n=1 Tax=Camponotus floridanus TaxID=104421 RepID=UPI000DC6CF3A|nr:myelin regulatory factor-like protein isoform X3 [Camponotus floridanus]